MRPAASRADSGETPYPRPAKNNLRSSAVWNESSPPCRSSLRSAATSATENFSPIGHLRPLLPGYTIRHVLSRLCCRKNAFLLNRGNGTKVIFPAALRQPAASPDFLLRSPYISSDSVSAEKLRHT